MGGVFPDQGFRFHGSGGLLQQGQGGDTVRFGDGVGAGLGGGDGLRRDRHGAASTATSTAATAATATAAAGDGGGPVGVEGQRVGYWRLCSKTGALSIFLGIPALEVVVLPDGGGGQGDGASGADTAARVKDGALAPEGDGIEGRAVADGQRHRGGRSGVEGDGHGVGAVLQGGQRRVLQREQSGAVGGDLTQGVLSVGQGGGVQRHAGHLVAEQSQRELGPAAGVPVIGQRRGQRLGLADRQGSHGQGDGDRVQRGAAGVDALYPEGDGLPGVLGGGDVGEGGAVQCEKSGAALHRRLTGEVIGQGLAFAVQEPGSGVGTVGDGGGLAVVRGGDSRAALGCASVGHMEGVHLQMQGVGLGVGGVPGGMDLEGPRPAAILGHGGLRHAARLKGGDHDVVGGQIGQDCTVGQIGPIGAVGLRDGSLPVYQHGLHRSGLVALPGGEELQIAQRTRRDGGDLPAAQIAGGVPACKLEARTGGSGQGQRVVGDRIGLNGVLGQDAPVGLVGDGELPPELGYKGVDVHHAVAVGGVVARGTLVGGGGLQQVAKAVLGEVAVVAQGQRGHAGDHRRGIGGAHVALAGQVQPVAVGALMVQASHAAAGGGDVDGAVALGEGGDGQTAVHRAHADDGGIGGGVLQGRGPVVAHGGHQYDAGGLRRLNGGAEGI